jgi:hypothetical protein
MKKLNETEVAFIVVAFIIFIFGLFAAVKEFFF